VCLQRWALAHALFFEAQRIGKIRRMNESARHSREVLDFPPAPATVATVRPILSNLISRCVK
jgi:hypothetical protein